MPRSPLHSWDLSPDEARALQRELAVAVDPKSTLGPIRTIGAADISYDRGDDQLHAAVVVVDAESLELIERAGLTAPSRYPYIPGLLSFREAPAILDAFNRLRHRPDVLICDGQGIAHPRGLGIASHLGLWLDLPTVGCAKKRLFGRHDEPGPSRGDRAPLTAGDRLLGVVLRTRPNVKPVWVSPGHRCDVDDAARLVCDAAPRYRLPAPIRMAHDYVNELRRGAQS